MYPIVTLYFLLYLMPTAIWIQTSIRSNRFKSLLLIISMPIIVYAIVFVVMMISTLVDHTQTPTNDSASRGDVRSFLSPIAREQTNQIFVILGPLIILRWLISYRFHRQIIFSFSGAHPLQRKDNPKLYTLVENLCISKGLVTPKIWIIDDDSLNAFAVWRNPKQSRIVFSKGLIEKLTPQQIQAVAGHELTHIINKDSQVMIIAIVFVWVIASLWELILRIGLNSRWGEKSNGSMKLVFVLVWFALLIAGTVFLPLIQLAISRKREFLADAGSVELTKDRESMISALQTISQDSTIESIKKQSLAAMCIQTPFSQKHNSNRFSQLRSTHPSIHDRVKALQTY